MVFTIIMTVLQKKYRFTPIVFFGTFGVCTILLYFLSVQPVRGFEFLERWTLNQNVKIWEWYVRESSVDNVVIGTVIAQLSLWNGTFAVRPTAANIDQLFLNTQVLINTDIFWLINASQDTRQALQSHLAHSQSTLMQIRETAQQLNQSAQSFLEKSKECLAKKRTWDQQFFLWVQQSDSLISEQWLQQSLEFAPCYITNRIQANAQAFLAQRVQANEQILQQRVRIIETNMDLFLMHSWYFEWTVLEDLLRLKRQLQQVNTVQYEQVAPSFDFNFDYLTFDYTLPRYDEFVIWPNHIPTFEEPWLDRVWTARNNRWF